MACVHNYTLLTAVINPNPVTMSTHGRIVNKAKTNPICKVLVNYIIQELSLHSRSNSTFLAGPSNILKTRVQ